MDDARRAIEIIRRCIAADRVIVLPHFTQRMDMRGLFWPDVLTMIDAASDVRRSGNDRFHRPKWIVRGVAADGVDLELVCALDGPASGAVAVFITIY